MLDNNIIAFGYPHANVATKECQNQTATTAICLPGPGSPYIGKT